VSRACPTRSQLGALAGGLAALLLLMGTTSASGERVQRGRVEAAFKGELSPLRLPRERAAPIALHLSGRLRGVDGPQLPQLTRIELALPSQGVLSTRGLPRCRQKRLRDARPREALAACGGALVGRGRLAARAVIPEQAPFGVQARLLAFNARIGGRQAVLLHAYSRNPPTVSVLPLVLRHGDGRFGTVLAGEVSRALGPWPRLSRFQVALFRRYGYRGTRRSFLSASCPIPKRNTAGFFSLARATYTLAGGQQISIAITGGCRAL
jgi:hypothetical protein